MDISRLNSHILSLSIALFVIGFSAIGANMIIRSNITDQIANIARETSEGFHIAFNGISNEMVANVISARENIYGYNNKYTK